MPIHNLQIITKSSPNQQKKSTHQFTDHPQSINHQKIIPKSTKKNQHINSQNKIKSSTGRRRPTAFSRRPATSPPGSGGGEAAALAPPPPPLARDAAAPPLPWPPGSPASSLCRLPSQIRRRGGGCHRPTATLPTAGHRWERGRGTSQEHRWERGRVEERELRDIFLKCWLYSNGVPTGTKYWSLVLVGNTNRN